MPSRPAQLLVAAAQSAARKLGGPCPALALAMQELRLLHHEGKVSREDMSAVVDLADEADAAGPIDVDSLVAGTVSAVQKIAYDEVLDDMLRATRNPDPGKAAERLEKVAGLGKGGGDHGDLMTGSAHDIVQSTVSYLEDPLGLSVPELDQKLRDGLERRGVGVMVAGTGVAKSMFLCHAAAEAIYRGKPTVYVTLELSPGTVKSRIYRNLTGMTLDEVKAAGGAEECARRWQMLAAAGAGPVRIVRRSSHETTVVGIRTWMRDLERDAGLRPEVLLIDPVDDLVDRVGSTKKGWEIVNQVFVRLRDLAEERGMYVWCASQAVRGKNRGQKIQVDDVADGLGKVRKATLVLGAYRTEDDEDCGELHWNVAKRTAVETTGVVGPLRHDFDRGRIAPVIRKPMPWEAT